MLHSVTHKMKCKQIQIQNGKSFESFIECIDKSNLLVLYTEMNWKCDHYSIYDFRNHYSNMERRTPNESICKNIKPSTFSDSYSIEWFNVISRTSYFHTWYEWDILHIHVHSWISRNNNSHIQMLKRRPVPRRRKVILFSLLKWNQHTTRTNSNGAEKEKEEQERSPNWQYRTSISM